MKYIQKFIKSYNNKKLKYYSLDVLIKFLSILISISLVIILLEKNAYFNPIIKQKLFNLLGTLSLMFIIFMSFKIIIHKYNLFGNSKNTDLANELIEKISTKDRIVNVLQIYSKTDFSSPYSDLTLNAINQLEEELKNIDVKGIKFSLNKKIIYQLIVLIFTFITLVNIESYSNAFNRLINKNIEFEREFPFSLILNNSKNNYYYENEKIELIVDSKGEAPNQIFFHIKNKNLLKEMKILILLVLLSFHQVVF